MLRQYSVFFHVYIILSLCIAYATIAPHPQAPSTVEQVLFAPICTMYIAKLLK